MYEFNEGDYVQLTEVEEEDVERGLKVGDIGICVSRSDCNPTINFGKDNDEYCVTNSQIKHVPKPNKSPKSKPKVKGLLPIGSRLRK